MRTKKKTSDIMAPMKIESRNNPIIKEARKLQSSKGRQAQGLHLIEGRKLLTEAVISGRELVCGFVEEGKEIEAAILEGSGAQVYTVTRSVLESLCDTQTPQGVCAIVRTSPSQLPNAYPTGILVALDAVQDPGNLGSILRTADAMGAAGALLGEGCADAYAPKSMRAAMGSTYHFPVWQGNLKEALQGLQNDGTSCICGHLQGEELLPHLEKNSLKDRCVIVIGNEGGGVSEEIAALCARARLPMYGRAESLNASVAAALLLYEVAKIMHS